jgi:hypothetical protein
MSLRTGRKIVRPCGAICNGAPCRTISFRQPSSAPSQRRLAFSEANGASRRLLPEPQPDDQSAAPVGSGGACSSRVLIAERGILGRTRNICGTFAAFPHLVLHGHIEPMETPAIFRLARIAAAVGGAACRTPRQPSNIPHASIRSSGCTRATRPCLGVATTSRSKPGFACRASSSRPPA